MDHYFEVRLLPDPEFRETVLMNVIFGKLHRALVEHGNGRVGVSFPSAKKTLGDVLRLHGDVEDLMSLIDLDWLKGLVDYAEISKIFPTPDNCKHCKVKRVQVKSNVERLYRRSVKKGWITEEEAKTLKGQFVGKEKQLKHPFVSLKSSSSGQQFKLFIQQDIAHSTPQKGLFSAYGLSSDATVPWF